MLVTIRDSCYNLATFLRSISYKIWRLHVERPSLGSLLFALIPYTALCFTVPLWDHIYPFVLGLPFNIFWLMLWLILTPVCMYGAYRRETRLNRGGHQGGGR